MNEQFPLIGENFYVTFPSDINLLFRGRVFVVFGGQLIRCEFVGCRGYALMYGIRRKIFLLSGACRQDVNFIFKLFGIKSDLCVKVELYGNGNLILFI